MIIDAKNLIAGRLAAYVAKQALLGEKVEIVNAEKAVVSGIKEDIFSRFSHRIARGTPGKGPFSPKMPHMILKRMIRGMLPHKQDKGRKAYKNIKCHIGTPKEFEGQKTEELKQFHKSKLLNARTVTLKQISEYLGKK
ncbi:MAG: 50S ribosomal protein L13 [archaeon]